MLQNSIKSDPRAALLNKDFPFKIRYAYFLSDWVKASLLSHDDIHRFLKEVVKIDLDASKSNLTSTCQRHYGDLLSQEQMKLAFSGRDEAALQLRDLVKAHVSYCGTTENKLKNPFISTSNKFHSLQR
jgi:hypothetical protein